MPRDAQATKARILAAAHRCFFRQGFARVGMKDIAGAAQVTKRTLYQHFDSKDALLEAMLAHQAELSLRTYAENFDRAPRDAVGLVREIFDDLGVWAEGPHYLGSGFTRLAMELCDMPGHPAMRFARQHKATVEGLLARQFAECGTAAPERLARQVWMLMEGAMLMSLLHGGNAYFDAAAVAARRLTAPRDAGGH